MSSTIKHEVIRKSQEMNISMIGFASVDRWKTPPKDLPNNFKEWIPEDHWPTSIFKKAKTVIVIGEPVFYPVVKTAPSNLYHELYNNVNKIIDMKTYELAKFINNKGYSSISLPRDGYSNVDELIKNPYVFFSHKHAAYLAGLGSFGRHNVLLTKKFGPRVRFNSILTSAVIPEDDIIDYDLCIKCGNCVDACPLKIIEPIELNKNNKYKENLPLINKVKCAKRSKVLRKTKISPCGICIKVCPVGDDLLYEK